MKPASSADSLSAISNYRFTNSSFLQEALTHKSYVNERRPSGLNHNERFEFLGDAVLSLVVSDYLASRYPELSEGALSQFKARLVSEAPLANAARRLDLGARLRLGRGEDLSKGREKASILADALEAVIAAVYLDGGLEASRNFTINVLDEELRYIDELQTRPDGGDYKTRFQEWCQKHHDVLPRYAITRETGPDHQKLFEVEVYLNDEACGIGQGYSKKEAEQQAAQRALERVEQGDDFPLR